MTSSHYDADLHGRTPPDEAGGQHDPDSMLAVALEMASYGWRVLPVYPPVDGRCPCSNPACDTPGKHPALSKWQTRATTDEAQIREWWSLWPAYNVGIATGRDSDLLALDADGMAGLAEVSKRGVPPSPMVQTGRAGGGMHHYFSCPQDFDARNFAGKVPGLDARANGGYVLAPDSKHVSGETYTWVVKPDGPLPEPPQWLIDLLKQDRSRDLLAPRSPKACVTPPCSVWRGQ